MLAASRMAQQLRWTYTRSTRPLHQHTHDTHTISLYSNNMNVDEIFSNHLLQATSELMKR